MSNMLLKAYQKLFLNNIYSKVDSEMSQHRKANKQSALGAPLWFGPTSHM